MTDEIMDYLKKIPEELWPKISVGIVVISIFLMIIFLAICLLYMKSNSVKIIKKNTPLQEEKTKEKSNKLSWKSLPFIGGRLGELLTLNGFIKAAPIVKVFFKVINIIKSSTYSLNWRYKLPFFMIVGNEDDSFKSITDSISLEKLNYDENDLKSMWNLFKDGAVFSMPNEEVKNKKFWSFMAELFVFIRPRRPLDGIVITLSADKLLSKNFDIETEAKTFFDKIFDFQHIINFRIPIYIMITNSNSIDGFAETAYLLPEDKKQQIFGWSNPYEISKSFSDSLVGEMFSTLESGIRNISLHLSGDKKNSDHLEKAILFERNFQKTHHALEKYLNVMFKSHNPEDGLLLRGVYFTGYQKKVEVSQDILEVSALNPNMFMNNGGFGTSVNNDVCFVSDLFEYKIFKEYNLAYPIKKESLDLTQKAYRNKAIFAAGSIISSLGWFYGNYNIKQKINEYNNSFLYVKTALKKIEYIERNITEKEDKSILEGQISSLLHNISLIKKSDMFSIFMPQTWFFSLYEKIMNTVGLVFDSSIVKAMFIDLNLKTKEILDANDGINYSSFKDRDVFDINSSSGFLSFKKLVDNLIFIKKMSSEYNSIRQLEDRKSVIDLTDKIFNDNFEIVEEMKSRQPHKQLMPPKFDIALFNKNIEKKLTDTFVSFINEVFNGPLMKMMENLVQDINALYLASKEERLNYESANLAGLYNKTVIISEILQNKNLSWINGEHFFPTDEYTKTINEINNSDIISNECFENIIKIAEVRFHKFKEEFHKFNTILAGNILGNQPQKTSEDFNAFREDIKQLLNMPFISTVSSGTLSTMLMEDRMLLWDSKRLAEISGLMDKYNDFFTSPPAEIRSKFLESYKTISRKCFYPIAKSMLGDAQLFSDLPLSNSKDLLENLYKKQADNIKASSVYLCKIAKFFDDNIPVSADDIEFNKMLTDHYMSLLEKIDALFNLEKPYSAGKELFSNWNGNESPKFLNVNDKSALKKYLTSQFKRVKFLAKDLASPVVDLLTMINMGDHINIDLIEKWKEIIDSVSDYEAQKPGNSISALEEFLSNTLRNVSVNSLDQQIEIKSIAESHGDFFVEKRANVASALLSRANILKYDDAVEAYDEMHDFFNEKLSNKFPFGNSAQDSSEKDIQNFIDLYEANSSNLIDVLKTNPDDKNISKDVFDFINSCGKMMPFLKAWIRHIKTSNRKDSVFTFDISMRPNPMNEVHASSIVDRILRIKDNKIYDKNSGIFFNGDSVAVDFVWVKRAEDQPYEEKNNDQPKVDKNLASFSYKGAWGMFRLIENHKVEKNNEHPNGVILHFKVPTINVSKGNIKESAIVILKITPMYKEIDKSSPITWPVFPNIAPNLYSDDEE